jgi:hypothetical protein
MKKKNLNWPTKTFLFENHCCSQGVRKNINTQIHLLFQRKIKEKHKTLWGRKEIFVLTFFSNTLYTKIVIVMLEKVIPIKN